MVRFALSTLKRGAAFLAKQGQGPKCFQTAASPLTAEVKGEIAKKAPTKVMCEQGKVYVWCACGLSGKQPFCDGSHKRSTLGLTPLRWTSPANKEVFFCNCKQTNKRPFCDGSHKKL